jgi:hypothetical protein
LPASNKSIIQLQPWDLPVHNLLPPTGKPHLGFVRVLALIDALLKASM